MKEQRTNEVSFLFALCLLLCALGLGVLACVAEIAMNMPPRPPLALGRVGRQDPLSIEELRVIFSACVVFYGVSYLTGRLFFSWAGAKGLAEEVRGASRGHMPLLNLILGIWLVTSGWQAAANALALPLSFFVGLVLVAWAADSGWSHWREWRSSQDVILIEDDLEYLEEDYDEKENGDRSGEVGFEDHPGGKG